MNIKDKDSLPQAKHNRRERFASPQNKLLHKEEKGLIQLKPIYYNPRKTQ